jgi:uncharacterized protein
VPSQSDSGFAEVKGWRRRAAHSQAAALSSILFLLICQGCSKSSISDTPATDLQNPILQERLAKDAAFKSDEASLILPQDRPGFQGLSYYPIDLGLRFSVTLHRYPKPSQVRLGTNTGEIRSGLRYGYFDFKVADQACHLLVYRLDDTSNRGPSLFIPFRDSTSGKETYEAGRYIDLKENTSGVYDLDFNRAYNPSCAYNNTYSCPVPPAENTLSVPIRAGEKKYAGAH